MPPEIGQLTALTKLALSDNQLMALPRELEQLTALRTLSVAGNPCVKFPDKRVWTNPKLIPRNFVTQAGSGTRGPEQ